MGNRLLFGVIQALLGILISAVPNYSMFQICQKCQDIEIKCYWAARTEYGVGILIIVYALLYIAFKNREIRMAINIAIACLGIFVALIATVIIGFCDGSCNPNCTCNPATLPVMTMLGMLILLVSIVNGIYLYISRKKKAHKLFS